MISSNEAGIISTITTKIPTAFKSINIMDPILDQIAEKCTAQLNAFRNSLLE